MVLIHQRHRQTNGRTTCYRDTLLCIIVHRAVKIVKVFKSLCLLVKLTETHLKPALQADRNAFIPQLVTKVVQVIRCHTMLFDRGSEKLRFSALKSSYLWNDASFGKRLLWICLITNRKSNTHFGFRCWNQWPCMIFNSHYEILHYKKSLFIFLVLFYKAHQANLSELGPILSVENVANIHTSYFGGQRQIWGRQAAVTMHIVKW